MPKPPPSTGAGLSAARLGVGLAALWLAGCAFCRDDVPAGLLRDRILPPVESVSRHASSSALPPPPHPHPPPQGGREQEKNPSPLGGREQDKPAAPCDDRVCPDGPLTLEQAIDFALRLNPNLDAMRERVAQAEGGRTVAFSQFLPEARLTLRHIEGNPASQPFALPTMPTYVGNIAPPGPADRFERAELSVQWIVWDFGRSLGQLGRAADAVEIARLQYLRARQTVAFDVAAAYFAVLQADATHRVADEAVRRAESMLRDARNFLKRGTAVRNDVLRAEVLVAEMRLNLVKARTGSAAAVAALNQVVGFNVSCPTTLVDRPDEPAFALTLGQCLQLAADNRDEFRVVLRTIDSARLGTGVARAEFLPKILVGGVGLIEDTPGRRDVPIASGGIHLELGLFEGGRRLGKLQSAEAEVREAVARGKELCDRIAYEVTLAHLAIDDARQRIGLSRTAVEGATENLRVVRGLFDKGDATPTDVVDAELAITRAQQNYFTALYDYQTALVRLAYAVGTPAPGGVPSHD